MVIRKFSRVRAILAILVILVFLVPFQVHANDTLYFRIENPLKSNKSAEGKYLRKAIQLKDSGWLALDYDDSNRLVLRSYFVDTNFQTKRFKQSMYSLKGGYCLYIRSYKEGKLDGINAEFNEHGDTMWKQTFNEGKLISTWISPSYGHKEIAYARAEVDAEYPGGLSRWSYYLGKNLVYPKNAIKKEIQGTVLVLFLVTSKGEVTDVQILKSANRMLDEEAVRLIKASPRWKPAEWDGIKVAQLKAQPVVFRLE